MTAFVRSRVLGSLVALVALVIGSAWQPASATGSEEARMADWANAWLVRTDPHGNAPAPTGANDDFTSARYSMSHHVLPLVAEDGRGIGTAGSGSIWLFDPVHHIMAVDSNGDVTGTRLFAYDESPPFAIPTKDLSRVRTARGIRLGMSSAAVLALLHLPKSALTQRSATERQLYARLSFKCLKSTCAHDEAFVFRNDRATVIDLVNVGP